MFQLSLLDYEFSSHCRRDGFSIISLSLPLLCDTTSLHVLCHKVHVQKSL